MTGRQGAAIAVWAVSWVLAIASLLLRWFADLPSESLPGVFLSPAPAEMRAGFDEIGVTVALVYGPVSALILARRPHPVGLILAVHAVGSGIAAFGVQWGLLSMQVPDLPLVGFFAFAAGWGFVPGTFMTAAVPLLVTRSRIPRWQWGIVWLCTGFASTAWFLSLTQQSVPTPVNPFAIDYPAYQAAVVPLYISLSFGAVAISMLSWVVLLGRWMRARGADRTGLTWLVLGHGFLTLSYLVLVLPEDLALPRWVTEVGLVAPVIGQVLYPTAILVVILGQRLWGVELVISRIVLWALLSIGGVSVYLVVVLLAPQFAPETGGVWIIVPLAVALIVHPLRSWLQGRIDHLIYGEAADPAALIARLGDRIGDLEPGPAGLRELADALRRVLRLASVEIRADSLPTAAVSGRRGGESVSLPLRAGSDVVGELIVRPPGAQRLDRRTLQALDAVTGLLAAAVRLVESHGVLEEAREALVSVRAEERRMLRRELHDGLGPALAGIGYGLAAVANLLPRDPERARELVAELSAELNQRVRAVRRLANDVMPSPLDSRELRVAVAELVARFDSESTRVILAGGDTGPVPAEVAEAAYFIVAEAVTNAARHAGAGVIEVSLERGESALWLRVTDDGRGIAATDAPGIGLRSMRERAELAGGDVRVEAAPIGTVVTARLAVAAVAAVEDAAP